MRVPELRIKAVEHDVDHAEPAFVVGVLLLEVGEVGRHHLEPRASSRASASDRSARLEHGPARLR